MADQPELFSRALMARALAYLYTAGAFVACLTLVFPHAASIRDGVIYGLAGLAVLLGLGLLWASRSIPLWAIHVALVAGTAIVAAANYFVGPSALYMVMFTWPALYAFYFFRLRVALAHLGAIAVSYAVVLAIQDPSSPIVRWLLAVGTPAVAGLMVTTLLGRVRREAAETARQDQILRGSEARTRAIVDNAPDAFIGIDPDGLVLSWNPAAERTFGWTAAEALGRPLAELAIPPEDRAGHEQRRRFEFERPDAEAVPTRRELELVRRDGARFPAEATVSRVQVGDRPMLACFIRDLTERDERDRQRVELVREQAAREEAEQMAGIVHGLQVLLDVALAHQRLDEMLAALLPRVCEVVAAEGAALLLAEEDGSLTVRASTGEPGGEQPARVEPGEGLAGEVVESREPLLVDAPDRDDLADPALHDLDSILTVPLLAGKEVTGVLQVGVPAPRRFAEEDVLLLGLAADRVALAIDHLRVYEREHRIAETLQRSLLPENLPQLPGIEVTARYMPAASESEVGGDWYDVIPLTGGRVGLVMGDVAGKGLAAASMVGALRSALRAYALEGHDPAGVVERLNRVAFNDGAEGQMTTLVYVVIDPWQAHVTWVNAGHLPPLAVGADGVAGFLEGPSSVPLGVLPGSAYEVGVAELAAGATVLLYTDGLVERPGEVLDDGLGRLTAAAHGERGGADAVCERVLTELVPGDGAADDVALLALRCPPMGDSFELDVASDPRELSAMRALLRGWLRHGEGSDDEIAEILTATAEAAANAIEHGGVLAGGPPFEVGGRLTDGEVEIVVRDHGGWHAADDGERGRGLVLMDALMDSVEIEQAPEGTTVRMRRRLAVAKANGGDPAQ